MVNFLQEAMLGGLQRFDPSPSRHVQLGAEKIDDQLFINPGSIRFPKKRKEKTYAIIEWNTLNDIQVKFYTTDGTEVHDLAYKTCT